MNDNHVPFFFFPGSQPVKRQTHKHTTHSSLPVVNHDGAKDRRVWMGETKSGTGEQGARRSWAYREGKVHERTGPCTKRGDHGSPPEVNRHL
jgi:hypothetical protein